MTIDDNTINRALDDVENSLEKFVPDNKFKCKHWVVMESLLVAQYTTRLENLLRSMAYPLLDQLETKFRYIISNRMKDFLVVAKDDYDKD